GFRRGVRLRPARTGVLPPDTTAPPAAPTPAAPTPAERERERALNRVVAWFAVGLGALAMTGTSLAQAPPKGAAAQAPQGAQVPITGGAQIVPGAMPPSSQTPPGQPGLPGPAGAPATSDTAA